MNEETKCDTCRFKKDEPIYGGREFEFGCLLSNLMFNCEGNHEKSLAKKQMLESCELKD